MWKVINEQSQNLYNICKEKQISITTAESCTGGMIASSIVSIPGSSAIFNSSIVTYSNESKAKFLKIPIELLNENGAVSKIIAEEMAKNVLKLMDTQISIAVTGIAGPSGGTKDKPVGIVWICIGQKNNILSKKFLFLGNRLQIRQQTTIEALKLANLVANKI
ncbi:MAG: CinA family protein [Proteobacteria bacterium]|jgi:PncC family amidohydrolase|nr:CinA family protein [Pseudomonadota bacterium]MDA1136411.1 CinA family protein [Pseudomonadota bacterium]|tara:strand:+ start:441 stop:929 length:489 start_codon:yes stop_codon:yes gene_type:complete